MARRAQKVRIYMYPNPISLGDCILYAVGGGTEFPIFTIPSVSLQNDVNAKIIITNGGTGKTFGFILTSPNGTLATVQVVPSGSSASDAAGSLATACQANTGFNQFVLATHTAGGTITLVPQSEGSIFGVGKSPSLTIALFTDEGGNLNSIKGDGPGEMISWYDLGSYYSGSNLNNLYNATPSLSPWGFTSGLSNYFGGSAGPIQIEDYYNAHPNGYIVLPGSPDSTLGFTPTFLQTNGGTFAGGTIPAVGSNVASHALFMVLRAASLSNDIYASTAQAWGPNGTGGPAIICTDSGTAAKAVGLAYCLEDGSIVPGGNGNGNAFATYAVSQSWIPANSGAPLLSGSWMGIAYSHDNSSGNDTITWLPPFRGQSSITFTPNSTYGIQGNNPITGLLLGLGTIGANQSNSGQFVGGIGQIAFCTGAFSASNVATVLAGMLQSTIPSATASPDLNVLIMGGRRAGAAWSPLNGYWMQNNGCDIASTWPSASITHSPAGSCCGETASPTVNCLNIPRGQVKCVVDLS